MDFIERLFHVAPDGGNGMTELAVALVCLFVSASLYWLRTKRRGRKALRS